MVIHQRGQMVIAEQHTIPTRKRTTELVNQGPIMVMSGLWIAPLVIFWLRVWGPLRPFDVQPVEAPSWPLFLCGLTLSVALWWVPSSYYRLREFEKSGRIYEVLGVRAFSRFVTDGEYINRFRRRTS